MKNSEALKHTRTGNATGTGKASGTSGVRAIEIGGEREAENELEADNEALSSLPRWGGKRWSISPVPRRILARRRSDPDLGDDLPQPTTPARRGLKRSARWSSERTPLSDPPPPSGVRAKALPWARSIAFAVWVLALAFALYTLFTR